MTALSDRARAQISPLTPVKPMPEPGTPAKAATRGSTVYHRFIPREEVQEATAWSFDAMDDKGHKAQADADAPQAMPEVDLEALRQQAYNEGFAHGRQVGEKETRDALDAPLRRTAEDAARRLAQLLTHAADELAASEDRLSEQLLELACDVARQVVRRELSQPLQAVRAVVDEALAATVHDELTRTVRLNPLDHALLLNHISGLLDSERVKLVPDDSVSAGGCVLETATGTVDGTLEKRWTRAVANLGLKSRWDVGQPSPGDAGHHTDGDTDSTADRGPTPESPRG